MERKPRILMAPSDIQGVGHFRNIWAAQAMQEHFKDEIEVEIDTQIDIGNFDYLSWL